jgi:hypothetical protein
MDGVFSNREGDFVMERRTEEQSNKRTEGRVSWSGQDAMEGRTSCMTSLWLARC